MNETYRLSKSSFLRGLRCKKSLYLSHFRDDLRDSLDISAERRMSEGQAVHELARELFPGGELARTGGAFDIVDTIQKTQELIDAKTVVLFEAAIMDDDVLTFADILERNGNSWRLYEVKSTNDVRKHHHWDVAIQVHVLKNAGFFVSEVYLVHLNREYVREGELDPENFFLMVPVLETIDPLLTQIHDEIAQMKDVMQSKAEPNVDIGLYCDDPDPCDFKGHCWAHIPEISVFNVYRLRKEKKFDLYYQGIIDIVQIPEEYSLSKSSEFHVRAHKAQETIIDHDGIRSFLDGLTYPLYYLDFETFITAIPPFDGLSPHTQVPFQYSLHVQDQHGAEPLHSGFLAEAGTDPRKTLLEKLLSETMGEGDIIVYNRAFEKEVLSRLSVQIPELSDQIEDRITRLVDLMDPFRKRLLYLPEMNGSASLKAVLPVVVPELGYEGMEIGDGMQAMEAFLALWNEMDEETVDRVRDALLTYCYMDTIAMAKVLEALYTYI